jgi:hypothetical protein
MGMMMPLYGVIVKGNAVYRYDRRRLRTGGKAGLPAAAIPDLFVRLTAGAGRTSGHTQRSRPIRERIKSGYMCTEETEPQVVVPIARGVVVAIRGARVPGVVVPGTAAIDPV